MKEVESAEVREINVGGIDPSPQGLRRFALEMVGDVLKLVLPGNIAYVAIGFALLGAVLALVSVSMS